jgi:hypothetical protein
MPARDKLTAKKKAPPAHWEQQLAELKAWVVATGGKIIVSPKEN